MKTTLDEWEIFQAVVQLGSFASAAEKLNRSQSTISYAMGRLQERLGLQLFELKGRKAMLTETWRALLADAEPLLAGFGKLEHRAGSLVSGGELEIRLSVDSLYPNQRLFAALSEFTRQFPDAHLRLRQATFLSAVTELVTHGADLCITGLISATTSFNRSLRSACRRSLVLIILSAHTLETVVAALSKHVLKLPATLRRSLTWDRGHEMAKHKSFTVDTNVKVYFCDPQSPWQRGTNENTNGLLRQYFPIDPAR